MKQFLQLGLCITIGLSSYAQTQIGSSIYGEEQGDTFGRSIHLSADGSIVAIGAPFNDENGIISGHVRVYENQNGVWTPVGEDIDGETGGDLSGWSVSLSSNGTIVAIGAPENSENGSDSGHVRVYENQNDVWTQIGADIDGISEDDKTGHAVSLSSDGSIVAIGTTDNDGNGGNSNVRVYENQNGTWRQIGADIIRETAGDVSGWSVSLSSNGNIVAIGAPGNDANGFSSGHVRVYENQNGTWTKIGADIDGMRRLDVFGWSVDLSSDGNIVAIGAKSIDSQRDDLAGYVEVYENQNGVWTQIGATINGEVGNDEFGTSVSLSSDGSIVAIGARNNDNNGTNSGQVAVYENQSGIWTQIGASITGETARDLSGTSVSLSSDGSILAIGAPGISGNGSDSGQGQVRIFDLNPVLSVTDFSTTVFNIIINNEEDYLELQLTNNVLLDQINLFTVGGQYLYSSKQNKLSIKDLSSGIYIVQVQTSLGTLVKKVVID